MTTVKPTKTDIASRLAEIKSLMDVLKEEQTQLKAQLDVGDSLKGAFGTVSLSSRDSHTYDEKLFQDLMTLGIDPWDVGTVKLTPNAKKVAVVEVNTPSIRLALDNNRTTKQIEVLRVKADATMVVDARSKVASMLP
jgi:hypothetical protein